MDLNKLWVIASAQITRYRESSFGGRSSSSTDMYNFCWDPEGCAFVSGSIHGFGCGNSWEQKKFPCSAEFAAEMLALIATEEVQVRFFRNIYSKTEDSELYLCADQVVSFHRSRALEDARTGRYFKLASFSFQFYGADCKVSRVSFNPELSNRLASRIFGTTPEVIRAALNKSRAPA